MGLLVEKLSHVLFQLFRAFVIVRAFHLAIFTNVMGRQAALVLMDVHVFAAELGMQRLQVPFDPTAIVLTLGLCFAFGAGLHGSRDPAVTLTCGHAGHCFCDSCHLRVPFDRNFLGAFHDGAKLPEIAEDPNGPPRALSQSRGDAVAHIVELLNEFGDCGFVIGLQLGDDGAVFITHCLFIA